MVELVRDSSWVNIHVFYKKNFVKTGTQLPHRILGLLGKLLAQVFSIPGNEC